MRAVGCLLSAVAFSIASESAFAECSLGSFDGSLPKALTGSVDLNGEDFVFGSDVDHDNSRTTVWNYIENKSSSRKLSVSWPKGQISLNILNPLAPGAIACKTYTVGSNYSDNVDDSAVIRYGNAGHEQNASVYNPKETGDSASNNIKSSLDVSYLDGPLKKTVHLDFFFDIQDGKITSMGLNTTEGYSVGIRGADNFWSSNTTKSFTDAALEQKVATSFSSWTAFTGNAEGVKAFLDYTNVSNGQALFANGSLKGFGIGEKVSSISSAEIIIFDSNRHPIVSSQIALPNTKEAQ
ncbi:hypothetical protein NKH72_17010 [Mesorhizobium sp. M0955]|uniref:hypothetical protein n=1 Tax=Mesorhizobium sp. M0955 TaxID=2957033 RepID=UPI00333DAC2B